MTMNYKVDIFDINSVLPHVMINVDYDSIETIKIINNEKIITSYEFDELGLVDKKVEDTNIASYTPDIELGKYGETIILAMIKKQAVADKSILHVEHVAETMKDKSPGYDIEVKTIRGIIGVEVKSTTSDGLIHLTQNEIETMIKMGKRYYLVIVQFLHDEKRIHRITRFIDFPSNVGIDIDKLRDVISKKKVGYISYWSQVFNIKIPSELLIENRLLKDDIYTMILC